MRLPVVVLLLLTLLPLFPMPTVVAQVPSQTSPLDQVNVFTGTSNSRWMLFPGANLPMGLVKLSPDNQGNVWNGGYEYTVASIAGFSFLHTLGLASFNLMPLSGSLENYPSQPRLFPGPGDGPFGQMWTAGYRSRIDKKTETGRPGYYAVDLIDAHTRVELTATERTGWMRLTPSSNKGMHLILDFGLPAEEHGELLHWEVHRSTGNQLTGSVTQRNKYAGEFTVFFDMQLSSNIMAMGSWENGDVAGSDTNYGSEWRRPRPMKVGVASAESTHTGGVWLDIESPAATPTVVRTGISLVGAEQAHNNPDGLRRRKGLRSHLVLHAFEIAGDGAAGGETGLPDEGGDEKADKEAPGEMVFQRLCEIFHDDGS